MLNQVSDLRVALDYLQAEMIKPQDFAGLVGLEKAARHYLQYYSDCLELAMTVGTLLQRRQEWEKATDWYLEQSAIFPDQHILKYDAAQTAVNGGDYQRAQAICEELGLVIESLTDSQLRGMWRILPFVALPEVALDAFAEASRRNVLHCSQEIDARMKTALANSRHPATFAVGVLSIGENCFPWTVVNRWGLRPKATLFEQESPWNLAQTWTCDVSRLLETDLNNLIEKDLLTIVEVASGVGQAVNSNYRFEFNHDLGSYFLDDHFANLTKRYENKIAKITPYFQSKPCVYFLYSEREGDLERLAHAVLARNEHGNFRLVIVDVWTGSREFSVQDRRVFYYKISLPSSDYIWFLPDHWDSDEGIRFERTIQNHLAEAVQSLYAELTNRMEKA